MTTLLIYLVSHIIFTFITYGLLGVYQKIGILDPTITISLGDVLLIMYYVTAIFLLLTKFILKKIDLWWFSPIISYNLRVKDRLN